MTQEMDLPAGPALDEAIHEHLFGHVRAKPCPICGKALWIDGYKKGGDGHFTPAYSTTGDGMLLVLAELRRRGWDVWIAVSAVAKVTVIPKPSAATEAELRRGRFFEAEAQELPASVALAALRAIRSQKP